MALCCCSSENVADHFLNCTSVFASSSSLLTSLTGVLLCEAVFPKRSRLSVWPISQRRASQSLQPGIPLAYCKAGILNSSHEKMFSSAHPPPIMSPTRHLWLRGFQLSHLLRVGDGGHRLAVLAGSSVYQERVMFPRNGRNCWQNVSHYESVNEFVRVDWTHSSCRQYRKPVSEYVLPPLEVDKAYSMVHDLHNK